MAEFKISGKKRRVLKKELSGLKFSLKHFWYFEDLDRAMGGGLDDATCQKVILDLENKISILEKELSEPHISILREDKLNQIL
jgi:hypothetical protein